MNQKWEKPVIEHGKMTKYNYIVQYPENLTLGNFFDIGETSRIMCLAFPKHFSSSNTFMEFVGKCKSTLVQEYDLIRQETLSELDFIVIK